jgi:hypothetical protein
MFLKNVGFESRSCFGINDVSDAFLLEVIRED